VLFFGTCDLSYSRNQIISDGLRSAGVEVVECVVPLWKGTADRVSAASGGWIKPSFLARVGRVYTALLRHYRLHQPDYDVMWLGYPGQIDVYPARLLSWITRKPLVLDLFMSAYLISVERHLHSAHPRSIQLVYWLEKFACRLPDRLIIDTAEYVDYFHQTYRVAPERFRLVPTGADDRLFRPLQTSPRDGRFRVLFYGTFIPLHGVETVIRAAAQLRYYPDIHFDLVGEGPEKALAIGLAHELGLTNVTFHGWIERSQLPKFAASADVCLGVFGNTKQGRATIQNKIYEGLAMGKPLITGDSETVRATLQHGEHAFLVPRADPSALAEALLRLYRDPVLRQRLAKSGYDLFCGHYTLAKIGALARGHLEELLSPK